MDCTCLVKKNICLRLNTLIKGLNSYDSKMFINRRLPLNTQGTFVKDKVIPIISLGGLWTTLGDIHFLTYV